MIYIALGANLPSRFGTPRQTLKQAIAAIEKRVGRVIQQSAIYLTAPVPMSDQPWFHNAVIEIETLLSPQDLLQTLHAIESDFGRVRSYQNAPRVIDLDILDYNSLVSDLKELQLPHPRMTGRAFVLYPLHDVAPDWRHPVTGHAIPDLMSQLPDDQKIIRDHSPEIMGVINVTPDSFSDGGKFINADSAIEHGLQLVKEGARILDIGGESTRPASQPVGHDEELRRILPVIRGLKDCGAMISIDTLHSETMRIALDENVGMINDISALEHDAQSISILAEASCQICLMHMQGTPMTMQANPQYDDVVAEVCEYLARRVDVCIKAGISPERLVVDPGIGFGKTLEHNIALLQNLSMLKKLGVSVLLGASRKSFIPKITGRATPAEGRLGGSLAAVAVAAQQNIDIVRVHDVGLTREFLDVYQAIRS